MEGMVSNNFNAKEEEDHNIAECSHGFDASIDCCFAFFWNIHKCISKNWKLNNVKKSLFIFLGLFEFLPFLNNATTNQTYDSGPVDSFTQDKTKVGRSPHDQRFHHSGVLGEFGEKGGKGTTHNSNQESSKDNEEEAEECHAILAHWNLFHAT